MQGSAHRLVLTFSLLAAGLMAAGCGGESSTPGEGGGGGESIRLTGSGASFPFPIYSAWFKEYSAQKEGVTVDYQSKGSGAGIKDFINGTVDFAASDAAMKPDEIAQVDRGVQLLPMTAGEVVLAYNLEGVKDLKLPRDVYPKIFLGEVAKWNDPAIVAANPGAKLPDTDITVVRRADSSGTTYVFTKHLSAISKAFESGPGVGKTVNWPDSDKFVASPKNDGVTATINQTPGAIGYIEYGYAKASGAHMALLQNKSGKYIKPGLESGMATLASAKMPADMIVWVSDPDGADAYPIATFTWMLFYKKYDDPRKAEALRDMVEWCLANGQSQADELGYVPLPPPVIEAVRKASANIK